MLTLSSVILPLLFALFLVRDPECASASFAFASALCKHQAIAVYRAVGACLQSLHFSPLIELLKCQRGPRQCREFNLPCRRTIKDRLMICKGPDNEYEKVRLLSDASAGGFCVWKHV